MVLTINRLYTSVDSPYLLHNPDAYIQIQVCQKSSAYVSNMPLSALLSLLATDILM